MEANSSENGMVSATINAPRTLPRNRNRMIATRMMPSRQIVQHRVGGVVHQIAAVEERNDLHAGRQDVLVQFLHFLVNGLQRRVGLRAFAQQHDAFHHIVVVDDLAVLPVNRFADLPQPDLRPLLTPRDVADTRTGVPFCVLITVCSMSCNVS